MTNKDKILEKLRKMMNLKESALAIGNEGEACAAAAAISRLLMAYNLSEADIPEQEKIDNPVVSEEIPFKSTFVGGSWYEHLVNCVCEYSMCRPLVVSVLVNCRYAKSKFQIVGRRKNIEVALFLISQLANKFYMIGKHQYPIYEHDCIFKYGRTPKSQVMFLRSFLQGCVYGLHDKFCAEKEDLKSECDITALAISMKAEIDEFLKDEKIGNAKLGKINIDSLCANRGYKIGKNIQVNKGVYAGVVNKDRRLMQ